MGVGSAIAHTGEDLSKAINPADLKLVAGGGDALKGVKLGTKDLGDLSSLLKKDASGLGDASKMLGKDAGGLGDASKMLGKDAGGLGDAGKGLGKDAKSVGADAKTLEKQGANEAGDAAKAEKNAPPLKSKADAENSMKDWVKNNPGKVIAGAASAAAIAYAADSYMTTNGAKVGITKIEAGKDGGVVGVGATDIAKITYTPELDILKVDFLTITGTDCTPTIDGKDLEIYKVPSKTEVWIKVSKALTAGGTKGQITLKTTAAARLGEAVGAGIGAGADAVKEAGGSVLDGLGLGNLFSGGITTWLMIGCAVLIIAFIIFKFVF